MKSTFDNEIRGALAKGGKAKASKGKKANPFAKSNTNNLKGGFPPKKAGAVQEADMQASDTFSPQVGGKVAKPNPFAKRG